MIFRFTLISDEVEDFMREIQIDSDATFFDLHKTILETCKYEDNQPTLFTMCENGWEMGQEVTLEEMDTESDEDSYVMAETRLSELIEDEKQHLLYTYDPLAERCFFIELSEIITGKTLKAPKVTRKIGDAPKQALDFDELFARNPINTDTSDDFDDEDMFGDGIDDEEIGLEGLDISDGNPYE
ncbi:MAG: plasmid pRiA4b ORF-3 family protein [Bacteroidaceae bacterium]|nr:plasmid pRiA4b ORF-3 family protein [Bacteroidaceae bacterium]